MCGCRKDTVGINFVVLPLSANINFLQKKKAFEDTFSLYTEDRVNLPG